MNDNAGGNGIVHTEISAYPKPSEWGLVARLVWLAKEWLDRITRCRTTPHQQRVVSGLLQGDAHAGEDRVDLAAFLNIGLVTFY